ncbi:MAG: type II secretion system F family protein [Hyphomicrobiaceae bacterium]
MQTIIDTVTDPRVLFMALIGISTFITIVMIALPALSRDQANKRMKMMALERDKMRAARMSDLKAEGGGLRNETKGAISQIVDQLNLRKLFESDDLGDLMKMAGFRGQRPMVIFFFFKLATPIVVFIAALIYLFFMSKSEMIPLGKIAIAIGAGYVGLYLPTLFIKNIIQKRQDSISKAFPDALDLLLICVQSGMSVEASFAKVSQEIVAQSLELGEELTLTTAELSYLPERRQAFENLGKRTGLPAIKATVTALIQAERYGTPVSQALRVMAKENRDMRMSEAEKKAAALPPKLTVPMIVFFLPVLFIVIIGPAGIRVSRTQ